jgi:hypothetical protein
MYNGKRRTQPNKPAPVEHHNSHSHYSSGDESDNNMGDEVVEQVVQVEGEVNIPSHISAEKFQGRLSRLLHVSFTGTPEEFAQNKAKTEWSLASHLPRYLKHNLAEVDRDIAGEEHLHGSLKRVIPVGLEVVAHRNSGPSDYGINIDKLMPQVFGSSGAALWIVPADTQYTKVNENIFEPTHYIDKHILDTMQVCTFDDLKEDIQVKAAAKGKSGFGQVSVGTLAHARLLELMGEGVWDDVLTEEQVIQIADTPSHRRTIDVPVKVAMDLRKDLEQPLKDLEKRCMNLEELVVRLSREDGIPHFSSPEGLHGQLVGSDIDPGQKYGQDRLNQICNVSVLLKLTYGALP